MALYRKYRPATFAEVVGQEHVTTPLSTALDAGRINHAYLFSGPRGCGKTSSARILARSLNCVQGPTSQPCGECASCIALGPGGPGNLDVIELDAASHGGVDDTRDLRDKAFYAPAESRYRVFIVDEAHMVTTAGFNALLKIVEEPPAHLIFIFATTEPDKVLPTIRSRTHHYPFRLLPPATMRGLLEGITAREGVVVDEAVFPLVIRAGGGSPRDSLSILDQLLAGAGDGGVDYARASALLGVTDVALIDDAVAALGAGDGAALFGTVDRVMEAGHDPRRFAVDLLERLRDLILLRAVPDAGERGLVAAPADALERMTAQAGAFGPATLARYAELLHAGLGEMRGATAPRLLLEIICARLLLPSVSDAESAVLQRIERLERTGSTSAAPRPSAAPPVQASAQRGAQALAVARAQAAPAVDPGPAAAGRPAGADPTPQAATPGPAQGAATLESAASVTAPAPPAPVSPPDAGTPPNAATGSVHSAGPGTGGGPAARPVQPEPVQRTPAAAPGFDRDAMWRKILARVTAAKRTMPAMLQAASIAEVTDEVLVLAHQVPVLADRLREPHNAELLEEAVQQELGPQWTVRWASAGSHPAAPPPQPAPVAPRAKAVPNTYARRSRAGTATEPVPPPADEEIPPPEEPAYPDDPDAGRMPAAAPPGPGSGGVAAPPALGRAVGAGGDEAALRLLQNGLGARRIG